MSNIITILKTLFKTTLAVIAILPILMFRSQAQTVSKEDVHQIVNKLSTALTDRYPFPEISSQYQKVLLQNELDGKYDHLTEQQLADSLTANLSHQHKDVHLRVMRNESEYKGLLSPEVASANAESGNELMREQNYGFRQVDLDAQSSIAYIDIPGPFYATQESFEMAAAAMNMAALSKYVILDVRANGGGSGEMGRFLASYFFAAGDEKFYLNGFYKDRTQDEQEWTYSYVPGKRNISAKVYILVSPNTGSAAEGFAYAMQQLHRATIVGETSAGAGIAGSYLPLKNNLVVFLPFKMVVAPHSQTGWEGTGVIPDSTTKGKEALVETRKMIWHDIIDHSGDSTLKASVQWKIDDIKATAGMKPGWQKRYQGIEGKYNNNRYITDTRNGLVWRKAEPGKQVQSYTITEVRQDVLTIVDYNVNYGKNSTRLYIRRGHDGTITELQQVILLPNGTIYKLPTSLKK